MCQIINSEMLMDYVLKERTSIDSTQLQKIRETLFTELTTPILIDITLRGVQEVLANSPQKFKITFSNTKTFRIERTAPPYNDAFLDTCYAPFFPKTYKKIKKILIETK